MPLINYVQHDGTRHAIDVAQGDSVMQGALNNMIDGIVAECGGGLACATCHCIVDEAWADKVGEPSADERDMLELVVDGPHPTSRLSCQIAVTEALDGLVVRLPSAQY